MNELEFSYVLVCASHSDENFSLPYPRTVRHCSLPEYKYEYSAQKCASLQQFILIERHLSIL